MYKRFTLDELTQLNTWFFDHLKDLYTARQHTFFKGFLQETMQEGKRVYFFKSNKPLFRIQVLSDGRYRFVDEVEKLELLTSEEDVTAMHNLFKNTWEMKAIKKENKTILDQLIHEYQQWQRNLVEDKPYIVYDIETTYTGENIQQQHFEMAYSISSSDDNEQSMQYKYIDRDSMKKYCDYLLGYDGRIIGYNQIWFDNPVLIHNVGYGKAELETLNKKSIDPFLFLWKTLGKRMKLSHVAQALVTSGKTLESGKEGSDLLMQRKKTGDQKALNKVKRYCKNDVHITLWVFLSLLKHQRINIEGKTYEFSLQDLLSKGWYTNNQEQSMNTSKVTLL